MSRAALIAKIKALLAKTVGNGCTEAEALTALAKARAMMDAYDVGDADLAFDGGVTAETVTRADRDRVRDRLCTSVAAFCHCRAWGGFEQVTFCGLQSEVVFAHWLLDMLADFTGRELALYLERTWRPGLPRVRRTEADGFTIGCVGRINARLIALCPEAPTGRGLVVARNALIDAYLADQGIHLERGQRSRVQRIDTRAHEAGIAAGERAQFNRPVDEAGAAILIGGTSQ